ncbi:hypothetical protein AVEN_248573-1 [Araneus ventricosus]|uniref:Uncharacterized protein n=1 Tax=Araneus ventricosus TaxID=182803 RepID=A0A4Y2EN74_ARAVE|nr:hypothetical protein AVEN_248573-1 [Araneus ventricosus]
MEMRRDRMSKRVNASTVDTRLVWGRVTSFFSDGTGCAEATCGCGCAEAHEGYYECTLSSCVDVVTTKGDPRPGQLPLSPNSGVATYRKREKIMV